MGYLCQPPLSDQHQCDLVVLVCFHDKNNCHFAGINKSLNDFFNPCVHPGYHWNPAYGVVCHLTLRLLLGLCSLTKSAVKVQ
jgi:hypothetical protein